MRKFIPYLIKEYKHTFMDVKTLFAIIILPVFMTLIVGYSLKDNFEKEFNFKDIKIIYFVDDLSEDAFAFNHFYSVSNIQGFQLIEINDLAEGMEKIRNGVYPIYIVIERNTMQIFKNSEQKELANKIINYFDLKIKEYNLKNKIPLNTFFDDYTEINLKSTKKNIDTVTHYSITFFIMAIYYFSLITIFAFKREFKVLPRLKTLPVKTWEIILNKYFALIIISIIYISILMCIYLFAFKINSSIVLNYNLLLIITEIALWSALGVFLACLIESSGVLFLLINIFIHMNITLGGGYYPNDYNISFIQKKSSFYHLFNFIVDQNFNVNIFLEIGINILVVIIFLGFSILILKKRVEYK